MPHFCRHTGHSNGEVFQSNVKIYSVYTHPIALILHKYEHITWHITLNTTSDPKIHSFTHENQGSWFLNLTPTLCHQQKPINSNIWMIAKSPVNFQGTTMKHYANFMGSTGEFLLPHQSRCKSHGQAIDVMIGVRNHLVPGAIFVSTSDRGSLCLVFCIIRGDTMTIMLT